MTASPAIEWRYDVDSSRVLRLVAHGFVAALGGSLLLVGGSLAVAFLSVLPDVNLGVLLLFVLLVLVGGPFSLLYLLPMITDADQRPTPSAFTGRTGTMPWTIRSVAVAALAGALVLGSLLLVGAPFDAIYALVVLALFSPVLVSVFSTEGSIDGDEFVCNGTTVSLSRVTTVRSQPVGNAVVFWLTYARGTGMFTPRLVTVPAEKADAVGEALDRGEHASSDREASEPDRLVQVIVGTAGLLFLGVAAVAAWAVDDPAVGAYIGGILGVIGVLLCVAGWRGL